MDIADQALFILDKTSNYQGTKTNELFNSLAWEYTDSDNKMSIKAKALNELISLMEGGNLFEIIKQEVKGEGIEDSIFYDGSDGQGRKSSYGLSQEEAQRQVDLFGENLVYQLNERDNVEVIINENTDQVTRQEFEPVI